MSNTDDLEAREPITHELKCHPGPFAAVKSGAKPFEWRKDDRDYRVGDTLWLREFRPVTVWEADEGMESTYTGQHVHRTVTYIIREGFGIPPSYCIMGLGSLVQPPSSEVVEAGNAMRYQLTRGYIDPEGPCASAVRAWDAALAAHPKDPAPTVESIMEVFVTWVREDMKSDPIKEGMQTEWKFPDLRTRLKTLLP